MDPSLIPTTIIHESKSREGPQDIRHTAPSSAGKIFGVVGLKAWVTTPPPPPST